MEKDDAAKYAPKPIEVYKKKKKPPLFKNEKISQQIFETISCTNLPLDDELQEQTARRHTRTKSM